MSEQWTYHSRLIGAEESRVLYDAFTRLVDEKPRTIHVWGKDHVEKRLTGTYTREFPASFTYSKTTTPTDGYWPITIDYLSQVAASITPKRADGSVVKASDYDLAHINYYRDGNDQLLWHWDTDGVGECIVSFSFYDPDGPPDQVRDFRIRSKKNHKNTFKLSLEQGSGLVMLPEIQQNFEHSVPARTRITRGRINVTLRQHKLFQKKMKEEDEHMDEQ